MGYRTKRKSGKKAASGESWALTGEENNAAVLPSLLGVIRLASLAVVYFPILSPRSLFIGYQISERETAYSLAMSLCHNIINTPVLYYVPVARLRHADEEMFEMQECYWKKNLYRWVIVNLYYAVLRMSLTRPQSQYIRNTLAYKVCSIFGVCGGLLLEGMLRFKNEWSYIWNKFCVWQK